MTPSYHTTNKTAIGLEKVRCRVSRVGDLETVLSEYSKVWGLEWIKTSEVWKIKI